MHVSLVPSFTVSHRRIWVILLGLIGSAQQMRAEGTDSKCKVINPPLVLLADSSFEQCVYFPLLLPQDHMLTLAIKNKREDLPWVQALASHLFARPGEGRPDSCSWVTVAPESLFAQSWILELLRPLWSYTYYRKTTTPQIQQLPWTPVRFNHFLENQTCSW